MPCFSTCPDGKHHCAMVHEHGGDHAASGCRWPDSRIVKRAEVWRMWPGSWGVLIFPHDDTPDRNKRVLERPSMKGVRLRPRSGPLNFPTHEAALSAALHEVGLTPTNPEEQQP